MSNPYTQKVHNAFNEARLQLDYLSDHVKLRSGEKALILQIMRSLDRIHTDFTIREED